LEMCGGAPQVESSTKIRSVRVKRVLRGARGAALEAAVRRIIERSELGMKANIIVKV